MVWEDAKHERRTTIVLLVAGGWGWGGLLLFCPTDYSNSNNHSNSYSRMGKYFPRVAVSPLVLASVEACVTEENPRFGSNVVITQEEVDENKKAAQYIINLNYEIDGKFDAFMAKLKLANSGKVRLSREVNPSTIRSAPGSRGSRAASVRVKNQLKWNPSSNMTVEHWLSHIIDEVHNAGLHMLAELMDIIRHMTSESFMSPTGGISWEAFQKRFCSATGDGFNHSMDMFRLGGLNAALQDGTAVRSVNEAMTHALLSVGRRAWKSILRECDVDAAITHWAKKETRHGARLSAEVTKRTRVRVYPGSPAVDIDCIPIETLLELLRAGDRSW